MPTYGEFETVEELASAGPFAVYSARKTGQAGAPTFAVKVYKTADMFADADVVAREAAAFLDVADLQGSLPAGPAGGGAGHWAPVHLLGRTSDVVFYVTDLYPVTVQRMIDSRRELDARSIAHVIEGVVNGLEELIAAKQRAHGALQPSNVLLGSSEVEQGQVALADPEPEERLEKNAAVQDQRGLASLLYQMVVYRQPPRAGSVATGPEWQRMGQAGELLRGLCEALLNAQPGQLVPYEQVRAKLAEVLRAKPPVKPGMSVGAKVAIAAVVLAVVGGGVYFAIPKPPPPAPVLPDPRSGWTAGNVADLKQRLDQVKPRIKDEDPEDVEEAKSLAGALGELSESIERFKAQPAPATDKDVDFLKSEIGLRDERYAALQKRVVKLEEDYPAKQQDRTKEPRVPSPDRWLVTRMNEFGDHVATIDRLLSTDPDKRAEFDKLKGDVKTLQELVSATRVKPWTADPAAQEEIARAVETAGDQVDTLRPKLKAMRTAARDQLMDYVKKASDNAGSLRSPQLQDRMKTALRTIREDLESSEARGWSEVTGQITKLDEALKSIDAAFATTLGLEAPPAGSQVAYTGADKHLDDLRESLITSLPEVADAADAGLRAKVEEAAGRYNARVADLRAMYTGATKAEALLASGAGLDESVDGASISALDASVRGAQAYEPLKAGVSKVLARVDALKQVKAMTSAPALVGVINDQNSGLSAVLTAWRALPATGYPANLSDLTAAEGVHGRVIGAITQKLGAQAPRVAPLTTEVQGQLRSMWLAFFEKANGSVPDVNGAFELTPKIPGGAEALAAAPAWLKLNHARWKLAKDAATVGDMESKQQIEALHPHVMTFVNAMKGLNLGGRAEVTQLEKDLNPFIIKKIVTLDEMGPAKAKWAFEEDKARGVARYRWTGKHGQHVLEFRPLVMGEDQVTYLCTTEMSVGLFADIVESFGKWEELRGGAGQPKKLMDAQGLDTRQGVRTIKWVGASDKLKLEKSPNEQKGEFSKNGLGWHSNPAADTMARNPYYPEGGGPKRSPDDLDPIDWVSPAASMYVARLVGCRLPSSGEWLEAAKSGANQTPNLRDASYTSQYQHVKNKIDEFQALNVMDYPSKNSLRYANAALNVQAETDEKARPDNDGYLYFAKVNEAPAGGEPRFFHLIGNVWEFTYEKPLEAEALQQVSQDSIQALVGIPAWDNLNVIGGSALSSPDVPIDQPVKFMRGDMPRGWSDVGFRLAFSTGAGAGGSGSPRQRLLAMLQKTPYLTKPTQN